MASLCFKRRYPKKPSPGGPCCPSLPFPSMCFPPPLQSPREREAMGAAQGIALTAVPPASGGGMTECSPSVPPALCRLLCPLPSPVIISACLPLSFPRVAFLNTRLWFPALPALPAAAETLSSGNGRSSGQRTPRDAAAGLEQFAALRAVVAFKSQFKCD